jgi:CD109 antigen
LYSFPQIGDIQKYSSNFKLQVIGLNGIKFNETATLSYNSKATTVLIQTDKAIYKPSERIQFRVLVVDGETKPVNSTDQPISAYIVDPKRNKIKQWQNITLTNGVFKGDLKLSREPAKGRWTLHFTYGAPDNRVVKTKNLEVAEYVLPKFEITTSQPVYNTFKSGKVVFGVEAKYTYGKPVKGTVTVKIAKKGNGYSVPSWRRRGRKSSPKYTYKVIPIDGNATIEIGLAELDLEQDDTVKTRKTLSLTVLEELTGNSLEKSITVPIYLRDYNLEHSIAEESFKPGLPYRFHMKLTRPDGTPMVDKENPMNVTVYYGFDDNKKTELSYMFDDEGKAFVTVTVPLSALVLDFVIKYRDADPYTIFLPRAVSDSNNFIQATVLTEP